MDEEAKRKYPILLAKAAEYVTRHRSLAAGAS